MVENVKLKFVRIEEKDLVEFDRIMAMDIDIKVKRAFVELVKELVEL
jgi:hypothetical protein